MIFTGELEKHIWQTFLKQQEARLTVTADDQLTVRLNLHRQQNIALSRDERYLIATTVVGQAVTTNMMKLALTFMGWQEFPHYALSLRSDAYLILGCTKPWPLLHAEREFYDLTIGLAETSGSLATALERSLARPAASANG